MKVVIAGGGFGGTAAMRTLAGSDAEVTLVDPKPGFDFLPMLPELVGLRLTAASLRVPFSRLAERYGASYRTSSVTGIDPSSRMVVLESGDRMRFDYLIVSTGAATNFHGNDEAARGATPFRNLEHAMRIQATLREDRPERVVIVGGGYTGIEVASQLRRYSWREQPRLDIVVVQLPDSILPKRPEWMQRYMGDQLDRLDVRVKTGCTVEHLDDTVLLSDGEEYRNCEVIWSAGVTVRIPFLNGSIHTDPQGRVKVDEALRASPRCYVIGDAAHVERDDSGTPLFMASYFAAQQGVAAARNVLQEARGRDPVGYRPRDLGFVVPLANGRGCGNVVGMPVHGRVPVLVHHLTGLVRARDPSNRSNRLRTLLRNGMGM